MQGSRPWRPTTSKHFQPLGLLTAAFVVTSLAEGGENMRFRSELGSVPLVLAVGTVCLLAGSRLCSAGAVERSLD